MPYICPFGTFGTESVQIMPTNRGSTATKPKVVKTRNTANQKSGRNATSKARRSSVGSAERASEIPAPDITSRARRPSAGSAGSASKTPAPNVTNTARQPSAGSAGNAGKTPAPNVTNRARRTLTGSVKKASKTTVSNTTHRQNLAPSNNQPSNIATFKNVNNTLEADVSEKELRSVTPSDHSGIKTSESDASRTQRRPSDDSVHSNSSDVPAMRQGRRATVTALEGAMDLSAITNVRRATIVALEGAMDYSAISTATNLASIAAISATESPESSDAHEDAVDRKDHHGHDPTVETVHQKPETVKSRTVTNLARSSADGSEYRAKENGDVVKTEDGSAASKPGTNTASGNRFLNNECTTQTNPHGPSKAASSNADEVLLEPVASVNRFSAEIYKAMIRTAKGNAAVSPLALGTLLAAVQHGAKGATANQIRRALHLPPDADDATDGYRALVKSMEDMGEVRLRLQGSVCTQKSVKLKAGFRHVATKDFGVELQEQDFADDTEEARRNINLSVERSTAGRTKSILLGGIMDKSTRMVMLNAPYFKAGWEKPFEDDDTREESFSVTASKKVQVHMMHGVFQIPFGRHPQFKICAISLPYLTENQQRVDMLLLLPEDIEGLQKLESDLLQLPLDDLTPSSALVDLALPALTIEYGCQLKEKLVKLGITDLFGSRADLSDISDQHLHVTEIVQKVVLGFDENGTDASTLSGNNVMSKDKMERVSLKFDHPFLFLVRNDTCVVFIGRVTDPTQLYDT